MFPVRRGLALDEVSGCFALLGAETSFFRPVARSFVFDVADRQPEQLDDRVIVGEVAAVLG